MSLFKSSFIKRFSSTVLGVAVLSAPIALSAQVAYTGSATTENFGAQNIGSPSAAATFNFSIASGTKVGSVAVLTTGLANMDFSNAAGTSCAAKTYASGSSCAVNVQFTPAVAGSRMGAIVFYSMANNLGTVLGSVPVYGTGTGPQIAYGPGVVSAVDRSIHNTRGLSNPVALTSDAAGNLFILDTVSNPIAYRLVEVPVNGSAPITTTPAVNGNGLYLPSCITVDGAGNIYIGDFLKRVVMIPTGGGAATSMQPTVNGIALDYPAGLAVDGAGDLYISDYVNNRVIEMPASGAAATAIAPSVDGLAINGPHGLALDAAGNLYIADLGNGRIVLVPANGAAATAIAPVADGISLRNPIGIAVDAAGDVYIADHINHRVVEIAPTSGTQSNSSVQSNVTSIDPTMYVSGIGAVYGVALSPAGDLFIVQSGMGSGTNIVEEIQHSQPPVMNFPTAATVGSVDTVDGLIAAQIVNIGNQPLALTAVTYPADFSDADSASTACLSSTTLNPGEQCDVAVQFTPQNGVNLSESLTLTYQASGTATAQQSLSLSGTAYAAAAMMSPSAGNTLPASAATFTWTPGFGATSYTMWAGTSGPGSSSLYSMGSSTATSATIPSIPAKGGTIYVRLFSLINRAWQYRDYTYTESSTPAVLTLPAQGTFLGAKTKFQWTVGSGVTGYELLVGSVAAGSSDLFDSGSMTGTTTSASGLPSNGNTIYVRLISTINGAQSFIDYTFQAATPAAMIAPAQGSALSTTATTFTWTTGSGVTGYQLWLGTSGPGSSSFYNSGATTSTSVTAPALPAKGATIYARLYSVIGGVNQYVDYTYTEAAVPAPATKPTSR